jgi:hypothetical protein
MIEEEIPKDVSLLRCTLKKSEQVFAKVVLLVSYAIVALALMGCGYLLFTGVLIPIISPVVVAILLIPWYYYLAGIAILAIPVYSFLWCIARELTDEDWENGKVKALAVATVFVIAAVVAAIAFAAAAVGVVAVATGVVVATFVVVAIVIVAVSIALDSKPMRFPGAYLHYRRRMRE